jgi:hypothetical protein
VPACGNARRYQESEKEVKNKSVWQFQALQKKIIQMYSRPR